MSAARPALELAAAGLRLHLRVTPRASRNAVLGLMDGPEGRRLLKVAVTAVPEDGKANAAVLALLAKAWRLPKSSLTVVVGLTDRNKVVDIEGDGPALLARLTPLVEDGAGGG